MWLRTLTQHFAAGANGSGSIASPEQEPQHPHKRRSSQPAASSSGVTGEDCDDDGACELVRPLDDDEFSSRPKRRSLSMDVAAHRLPHRARVPAPERRTSLEQWQEARRARNSMEGQSTTTTDRLTVCKAGSTTILNKTYITIKPLGCGSFGRVVLAFNVFDQRLYAIKICRKSQFAAAAMGTGALRHSLGGRLRRSNNSGSNLSSCSFGVRAVAAGCGGSPLSAPLPAAVSCLPRVAHISAASMAGDLSATAATAPALPPCSSVAAVARGIAAPPVSPVLTSSGGGTTTTTTTTTIATATATPLPTPTPTPTATIGGGVNVLLCTDGSTGSMNGSSVFTDALLRFQTEEMVREIAVLKKLHHPNIVNLAEVIDDPSDDTLLLVMEYVEGGTLEPRPRGPGTWHALPERDVWRYVRDVLQGLDYLHTHRIVHGDLKPANLLLDSNSGRIKIADFGSSIIAGSERVPNGRCGPGFSTPAFRSPESLTSGYVPSYEMDMWALGVCVFMWTFGCLPFTGAAPYIIYEKIRGQDPGVPAAPEVSPELRDLLSGLLAKDVLQRLHVRAAMQHPWVTLNGSAPLHSIRGEGPGAAISTVGAPGAALKVTQADIDAAIRRSAGSAAIDAVFEEVALVPGQVLVAVGDAADQLFLIATGEVEIIAPAPTPDCPSAISGPPSAVGAAGTEPLISGLRMGACDPYDGELWDSSHNVSELSSSPGTTCMMLLAAPTTARNGGTGSRLLAVKGPGDSLGAPLLRCSSGGGDRRWKVLVRARSAVKLFRAALQDLRRLVEMHPEAKGAVQAMLTQQETDMMVAEAMCQLHIYGGSHARHQSQSIASICS